MVSAGSYLLSAALLAVLALSLGFSAVRLRRRLMPDWEGAPAHLVEAIVGVALLIWLSELLGAVGLLYAGTLVAAAVLLAVAVAFGPRVLSGRGGAGASLGFSPESPGAVRGRDRGEKEDAAVPRRPLSPPPAGGAHPPLDRTQTALTLVAIGVVAVVFAHWGLTTEDALDRGIFNFDSLWYHMPFAVDMAQSHSVTGLHYTETVFTNWFYPQNSELLHAVGILLTGRDTLSLVPQLRLAGDRLPGRLVHRPALRPRAADGRRGCDPARVPHARRARAGSGQERPGGRRAAARGDRDPRQRAGARAATAVEVAGRTRRPVRTTAGERASRGDPAPGWAAAAAWLLRARRWRHQVDRAGDGGGADARRDRAGARGAALGGRRLVVRAGAGRRRLLVPAQPDRRRQPAAAARAARADLAAASRAAAGQGGPTSASSTTRPTPASGATTSTRACTRPSARSGRWSSPAPSPAA